MDWTTIILLPHMSSFWSQGEKKKKKKVLFFLILRINSWNSQSGLQPCFALYSTWVSKGCDNPLSSCFQICRWWDLHSLLTLHAGLTWLWSPFILPLHYRKGMLPCLVRPTTKDLPVVLYERQRLEETSIVTRCEG